MLSYYPDLPALDPTNDKTENWTLREAWISQLVKGRAVRISHGFVTDGASIPRVAWRVIGHPFRKDILPHALAHDALYAGELMSRSACDAFFLDSMKLAGVSWVKRNAIWSAVRLGGWAVWMKHTHEGVADARRKCGLIDADAWAMTVQAIQSSKYGKARSRS